MKINHILLISLLIVGALFIPAVSAECYTFDLIEEDDYESSGVTTKDNYIKFVDDKNLDRLGIINSELLYGNDISTVFTQIKAEYITNYNDLPQSASTTVTIDNWGRATYGYYKYTSYGEPRIDIYLSNFEVLDNYPTGLSGDRGFDLIPDDDDFVFPTVRLAYRYYDKDYDLGIAIATNYTSLRYPRGMHYYKFSSKWENTLTIDTQPANDIITLNRYGLSSQIDILTSTDNYTNTAIEDYQVVLVPSIHRPYSVIVTNPISGNAYRYNINSEGILHDDPDDPDDVILRTGTVTMTDHNGTRISGFEVKAVNYYTGKEYTVSTNTDVATITLPMDRIIAFRNPQTGQYEDVPVGYYIFFVSKPGYKMTSEDGVRISVMPVEYSSYHLGDIIVTSEDGYLSGKHQFQIRSRADLSILQTGTISAQSATTGEWFNTTVTDGIATLILPYDTSNPYYEYVGNYYVYATSPGYIPSEYATQISVRPDTQSEIRWILLTPIGGIPEPGNVTLRIQAVSDSWQDIPNAQIHIDGVAGAGWEVWDTYTATSTGYLEVSVYENSTYDITVYGEGYYSSSQRIEVFTEDPPLLTFILYPTGAPTLTPTPQPTGWVTPPPTTQPSPGIPDEDDDSEGFLMEAIRGISKAFGVGFATGKTIFGMLLALAIGFATAKQLRGGAAEFGLGLLGGTMLGVLIGLIPIWVIVVLLLIVGMYIGYRYVGGSSNG